MAPGSSPGKIREHFLQPDDGLPLLLLRDVGLLLSALGAPRHHRSQPRPESASIAASTPAAATRLRRGAEAAADPPRSAPHRRRVPRGRPAARPAPRCRPAWLPLAAAPQLPSGRRRTTPGADRRQSARPGAGRRTSARSVARERSGSSHVLLALVRAPHLDRRGTESVFTVPRGVPSASEISRAVRPRKYARQQPALRLRERRERSRRCVTLLDHVLVVLAGDVRNPSTNTSVGRRAPVSRRRRSTARLCAIVMSQVERRPRAGSNRAAFRQAVRKTS